MIESSVFNHACVNASKNVVTYDIPITRETRDGRPIPMSQYCLEECFFSILRLLDVTDEQLTKKHMRTLAVDRGQVLRDAVDECVKHEIWRINNMTGEFSRLEVRDD